MILSACYSCTFCLILQGIYSLLTFCPVSIDFLAPKARQDLWFLAFVETLPSVYPSSQIASYPGLLYAKALCLRNMEEDKNENDDKSSAALRDAILTFPMVTSLLYASLGGDIPPALLSNRRSQVDGRFS